ncbi:hypothetical protein OPKNFCMD_3352 [Methylobacterium crusticola]|uniref:VWFA domain-containing protein n=1 Tax=Methylobacterium crusticola TaxID=1697972 RepID=A0ABQ4QZK4_9HYPH|nr:hypothetical protein OPKNFCMD_3352 [Methylobacterium crusticola]
MKRLVRRFQHSEDGVIAVVLAIVLIPVIFLVGAGIDYARTIEVKAEIQSATDATALAVIRESPSLTSDTDFKNRAQAFFTASFPAKTGVTVTSFTPTRVGVQVTIAATATVDTSFSRIMHPDPLVVSGSSQATAGGKAVEVALVLDNTGSMNDSGKLAALKQASKDFLAYLDKTVVSRSDAKVALVPFARQVNLGTAVTTAGWLSYTKVNAVSKTTWKGCIDDRDQSYDVQLPVPEPSGASAYPADTCDTTSNGAPTLTSIRPLTTDYASLNTAIDSMTAGGNTNVTIGVAWGMEALTPYGPLATAVDLSNDRVTKIMVVLTDGDNTENRWQNVCTGTWYDYFTNCLSASSFNARTLSACTAAKNAGITIYTVRVIDGNADMLKSCASKDGFFYNVITANDLKPAFQSIGSSIAQFRLTQ